MDKATFIKCLSSLDLADLSIEKSIGIASEFWVLVLRTSEPKVLRITGFKYEDDAAIFCRAKEKEALDRQKLAVILLNADDARDLLKKQGILLK